MKIGIVNYSLGNVGSVYSAFEFYKYDVSLVNRPADLKNVDMIVLAGVGNFTIAAGRLKALNFVSALHKEVIIKKKPVLGICLGMQLFADESEEGSKVKGLGWIPGKVVAMKSGTVRIPHIGWNEVKGLDRNVFPGLRYNQFYFMHSYKFIPEDPKAIIATTEYGDVSIVSAVRKDNIIGVQFHPEKSQGDGLRLLHNVVEALK